LIDDMGSSGEDAGFVERAACCDVSETAVPVKMELSAEAFSEIFD
jgi:hypothetical protein